MALTKCKECGKEVSKKAESCPGCGAPIKGKSSGTSGIGCGGLAVVLIFGFVIWNMSTEPTARPKPPPPEANPVASARGACRTFIQGSLNDPGSAKFEPISSWGVDQREDGTILVQPHLRAKNAFGGMIYTVWNCEVRIADGDVRLISLKQISP